MNSANEWGSVVVISLERAGRRIGGDRESEATMVEETVGIDQRMGLTVDGISQLYGAAHGATVACCLSPSRGQDR